MKELMKWKFNKPFLLIIVLFGNLFAQARPLLESKDSHEVALLLPIELSTNPALWFHPYAYFPDKNLIAINATSFAQSGLISGRSLLDLYKGKLQSSTIDGMLANPLNEMKAGAGYRLEARAYAFKKSHSTSPDAFWNLYYSAGDESLTEIRVDRDYAGLILKGNAPYSGKTIESNPLILNHFSFQRIGLGISGQNKKNAQHKWYVQLNGIAGRNWAVLKLEESSIYNSVSGDSVVAKGKGIYRGNTLLKNPYYNGAGFSFDAGWMRRMNRSYFSAEIRNIGLVKWRNNAEQYHWDTTLVYEGLEWNRAEGRFLLPAAFSDSGIQRLSEEIAVSTLSALPFEFGLKSGLKVRSQVLSVFLEHRMGGVFQSALGLEHEWFINPKLRWSNQLRFGGYSLYNINSSLDAMFSKNMQLKLAIGGWQMFWGHRGGPTASLQFSSCF